VQPARVTVRGPAEEVRRLTAVETVPVDLNETRGVPKRMVRLSTDGKPLTFSADQVEVSVVLEEEQDSRDFTQLEIGTKDYKGNFTINPKTIFLRVSGPKNLVDKLQLNSTNVFVNLQGLTVGDHNVPPQFELPSGVKVVEQKPAMIRVKIIKSGA
jgi:YbbR domain-containing protein